MPRNHPRPEYAQAIAQGLRAIGETAEATGVTPKMIRHYESIGLMHAADRTFAGYRLYNDNDLHRLRFIKRARTLGFSIKEIEQLLNLWDDRHRASSDVKQLALQHARELEQKIREMQAMRSTLVDLAAHCHGDEFPECPILDDLAGDTPKAK
ncbi:Cu(I)-responsive transcriptional regulator [Dyella psychrodurans]|uniref:Cu(I)-responsive transcriptional regulator n=1 Tax=Dyella psychrodurans TaxID=1927960 RepID=A0A370X736_9GAMM|nr:Cu(I)-responsive transcriptional regulator [Dyella psychrodurans]RDS84249.1 Cu(I)-responsive transcriptional regulator [Dyella psychrodurans]